MTELVLYFLLINFAATCLGLIARDDNGMDLVACTGILALAIVSVETVAWLFASSLIVVAVMQLPERFRLKYMVSGLLCVTLIILLPLSRDIALVEAIGAAYFTLRHVHVLLDWSNGQLETPSLRQYLRYQFFLPVLLAGPIHRYQNFLREVRRRRPSPVDLFSGLERVLIGLFSFTVICNWGLVRLSNYLQSTLEDSSAFLQLWVAGAFEWLQILAGFGGLSAIAIGFSRMLGMAIEENFNRPWMARDLMDFWSRWHITLSSWCRDYVFNAAAAITRRAEIAIFASAIAMGLWHGTSVYYVLWGIWQGLGIVFAYVMVNLTWGPLARQLKPLVLRLMVPFWLSLTKPVCTWAGELIW